MKCPHGYTIFKEGGARSCLKCIHPPVVKKENCHECDAPTIKKVRVDRDNGYTSSYYFCSNGCLVRLIRHEYGG